LITRIFKNLITKPVNICNETMGNTRKHSREKKLVVIKKHKTDGIIYGTKKMESK